MRTRRILKNAIKQVADDFSRAQWNDPYETICHLHKELVRNTLSALALCVGIGYSIVGFFVLLKKLFRSDT